MVEPRCEKRFGRGGALIAARLSAKTRTAPHLRLEPAHPRKATRAITQCPHATAGTRASRRAHQHLRAGLGARAVLHVALAGLLVKLAPAVRALDAIVDLILVLRELRPARA